MGHGLVEVASMQISGTANGAEWDRYAGASMRFEPTICDVFSAGYDGVGVTFRAPVGTVGQCEPNGYVKAARLVPSGVISTPLATTGIPEPDRLEPPNTIGTPR